MKKARLQTRPKEVAMSVWVMQVSCTTSELLPSERSTFLKGHYPFDAYHGNASLKPQSFLMAWLSKRVYYRTWI